MAKVDVSGFVVYGADGSVDVEASRVKFAAELETYVSTEGANRDAVRNAVMGVFSAYPGARLNMTGVIGMATRTLGATPLNDHELRTRVHKFVQENAGSHLETDKIFEIRLGTGGGVALWTDELRALRAKEEAEKAAKEAAKAAKAAAKK